MITDTSSALEIAVAALERIERVFGDFRPDPQDLPNRKWILETCGEALAAMRAAPCACGGTGRMMAHDIDLGECPKCQEREKAGL